MLRDVVLFASGFAACAISLAVGLSWAVWATITKEPSPPSDEWATPRWLFDHFDREFRYTLDACAKGWNAKTLWYADFDGLELGWDNNVVWCNPPYSNIAPWVEKAHRETQQRCPLATVLVPCVPDRKWWALHVEGKAEVRCLTRSLLPSGRIHFEREDGTAGRAPFPSALLVYRNPFNAKGRRMNIKPLTLKELDAAETRIQNLLNRFTDMSQSPAKRAAIRERLDALIARLVATARRNTA